jgi:hypothetical protein
MERHFIRMGKNLQRLAVSHAVPAGNRKVTVVLNFRSEHTVKSANKNKVALMFKHNAMKTFEGSNGGKAPRILNLTAS